MEMLWGCRSCREIGHLKCLLPCSLNKCSGHFCDMCEPRHRCHYGLKGESRAGWRRSFDRDPDQDDDYEHRIAAEAQKHDSEFGPSSFVARGRHRKTELEVYRSGSVLETSGGRMVRSLWQGVARFGREGQLPEPETGGAGYGQLALQEAEEGRLSIDIRVMEMREKCVS